MSEFRKRVLGPALIPLGAFAFIGVLAYAVSRILLAVTKEGSVVVATLMSACILFAAAAVAKGGVLKNVQRISLIAFSLLLLGGGIAVEASLGPRDVEGHLEVLEEPLVAENIAFTPTEFNIPADKPVGIKFENRDAGVQHNIAIFRTEGSDNLFRGAIFPGVATRTYEVPALPAGPYFFWCDVHTAQMRGTIVAGGAPGTPRPSPPPTPGPVPSSPPPSPSPGAASPSAPIPLVANNLAFDKNELTFPAGSNVAIRFSNQEAQPHNWALYAEETYTTNIFRGEIFTGPGERTYTFTAPSPPGTYYFRCDVHPTMTGTATVT